ncbi:hypothetical protein A8713_31550 [Streptomyces sp. SAT1]|uniref:hypothetical protein n=1 Tax=Streptomyces sp. SAT1 TaxID=1849967 RepID=UPI0007DD3F32|nr:hypothetical protein [Streptomyces sp. SAT1]ANH95147.1 hypothetical protein A8713_31550 [Streptomyces sp. SAT1]
MRNEITFGPDASPFKSPLVKAVFRDVTPMHVSRSAAWTAASVTRTVLTEIIDGARRAAAEEARKKLVPGDLLAAIDRNVELEVGTDWYHHSPTFRGLTGVLYDAEGVVVPSRQRRGPRRPSAVAGAHRFEAGIRRLLRSRGVTAVPAMVRDLDGIASVFLTDLARDAARVVRGGSLRAPADRIGDGRTIGRDDVLTATTIQLFGGALRQQALAGAGVTARDTSVG